MGSICETIGKLAREARHSGIAAFAGLSFAMPLAYSEDIILQPPIAPPVVAQKDSVPTDIAYRAAESQIRGLYKQEYASNDTQAKRTLAEKLVSQGNAASNPAEKYAFWKQAKDIYWGVGDYKQGFEVLDKIAQSYSVEMSTITAAISDARATVRNPEQAVSVGEYALGFGEKAIRNAGNFVYAEKAIADAKALASTGKDKGLYERAD